MITPRKLILFVALNMIQLCRSEEGLTSEGREFHSYLPLGGNRHEYQIFQYPHNFPYKEDYLNCAKNPLLPLLGKGLNLLLIKLGAVGLVKAVLALVFLGFLIKLPLLLLKLTFLKSFFLPFLMAPMLLNMFGTQTSESGGDMKPSGGQQQKPGMIPGGMPAMMPGGMPGMKPGAMPGMKPGMKPGASKPMMDTVEDMGRQLNDNITSVAWESLKMFAESDQCAEKISCMVGASSKDSSMESIITRVLKYLHHSSPPILRKRVTQIREAFNKGSKSATCLQEEYECHSPELLLQYGIKKVKIL